MKNKMTIRDLSDEIKLMIRNYSMDNDMTVGACINELDKYMNVLSKVRA